MNRVMRGVTILCAAAALLVSTQVAQAFDFKVKYIIPTMKTQEDADKIVKMLKDAAKDGFKSADVYLDDHKIIFFYDDEEFEDEKLDVLIPLKKAGYRVERRDVLYEDPNKRN